LNFSPIQNHIISRLKNTDVLRYAQIKPENIDNDLYNYHLQQLVKKGFVLRSEVGYSLSLMGIKLVADSNLLEFDKNSHHLFKVNVLTIVIRAVGGELQILQQMRTSNPSYGKIGVPGGVVQKGETIEDAAQRKLKVETGLEADFKLLGCDRRILYQEDELFSDIIFPICYTNTFSGELLKETEYGQHMWNPIDKAIEYEKEHKNDNIKSLIVVLTAIQENNIKSIKPFFNEYQQNNNV